MTDLSASEVELLYAIKHDQGRTLTYYGDELRKHYTQLTRTLEHLKLAGYVRATENNRLYISDEFKQRQQAEPEPESVEETVEELAAVAVPETPPALEAGMKVTPEMIAEYMADKEPRTAAVIAQHFGLTKGTFLINPLRKLVTDGVLAKIGTIYSIPAETIGEAVAEIAQEIAQEIVEVVETETEDTDEDLAARLIAVLEKDTPAVEAESEAGAPVVEEPRGNLPSLFSGELQNHILKKRNAFTAAEVMQDFAESHFITKDRFDEIFEDMAASGDLMCWDGAEFIDPALEYVPGATYIVLRKTEPTDAIAIMDEYCENIRGPYKLFDIVETTHIHHADVLRYLVDFDYDVTFPEHIVKGPYTSDVSYSQKTAVSAGPRAGIHAPKLGTGPYPVKINSNFGPKEFTARPKVNRDVPLISYAMIENLKPQDITDFLDGGVKVDVFIRKFNLHPDDENHIVEVLTLTGVAELTSVEGVDWLFLKNRSTSPAQPISTKDLGNIQSPTGQPARKWTPVEKESLRDALKIVAQEESKLTTALDIDPKLPETVPSDFHKQQQEERGHVGDLSGLMKEALHTSVSSEEDRLDSVKIGALRDLIRESTMEPETIFMSREMADELGVPVTECTCTQRVFGDELHEDSCPVAELENAMLSKAHFNSARAAGPNGPEGPTDFFCKSKPNPQWLLTLKMLEERMRFEHQGSAADQLHEIRKYLEP